MPIPRPKILTRVTVPAGGWTIDFDISIAAQYDTNVTATVPAGDYYIAWDGQSDDLLYELSKQMTADSQTAGKANSFINVTINSDFTTRILFNGSGYDNVTVENDVRINWTASTAGLASALGFDNSADDTSTATDRPAFDSDWQHAYAWYATEDGMLENFLTEDINTVDTPQAIAYSGRIKSQNMGTRYTNELQLNWLTRALTYSRGVGYGTAPVHPYARNKGLECWWESALLGTEFRVYRDHQTTHAVESGALTAADTTTVTDSAKAFDTDPQEHVDRILLIPNSSDHSGNDPKRFKIASHTATAFTAPNASSDELAWYIAGGATNYSVYDVTYQTYVVDLSKMKMFDPQEIPGIDRYKINIPLLRYVA